MSEEEKTLKHLTRREFLKDMAIGTTGLAASSVLSGCSPKVAGTTAPTAVTAETGAVSSNGIEYDENGIH
jgi:hypothetical protein